MKRFTDCGKYLICFSRHLTDVITYKYRGYSRAIDSECDKEDDDGDGDGDGDGNERRAVTMKEIEREMGKFESYFSRRCSASLSAPRQSNDESFCKDFLFTAREGRFLVVASSTQVDLSTTTENDNNNNDNNTNAGEGRGRARAETTTTTTTTLEMDGNDLSVFNELPTIESITFHVIRTETGEIVDSKTFSNDFMRLQRNQCATMYNDSSLAIVSLKHRSCTFLDILEDGKLAEKFTLGPYCEAGDEEMLAKVDELQALENTDERTTTMNSEGSNSYNSSSTATKQKRIMGLMQKLLVHRFLDALSKCEIDKAPAELRNFHKNFEKLATLTLVHARQLDDSLLLLKFVPAEAVHQIVFANASTHKLRRRFDDSTHRAILTIYDLNKCTFLHVVPCSALEAMNDDNQAITKFLNSNTNNNSGTLNAQGGTTNASSYNDGAYAFKSREEEAVFFAPAQGLTPWQRLAGGRREDVAKSFIREGILNAPNELTLLGNAASLLLSIDATSDTSQTRTISPYFDRTLFQYDERIVSAMLSPKPRSEFGVKFTPVEPAWIENGKVGGMQSTPVGRKFTLRAATLEDSMNILQSRSKRHCSYVFHPCDPFALSITQSFMQPSQMCFHTRLDLQELKGGSSSSLFGSDRSS